MAASMIAIFPSIRPPTQTSLPSGEMAIGCGSVFTGNDDPIPVGWVPIEILAVRGASRRGSAHVNARDRVT